MSNSRCNCIHLPQNSIVVIIMCWMKDNEEATSQGQSPWEDTGLCFASQYSVHLLLQLSGSLTILSRGGSSNRILSHCQVFVTFFPTTDFETFTAVLRSFEKYFWTFHRKYTNGPCSCSCVSSTFIVIIKEYSLKNYNLWLSDALLLMIQNIMESKMPHFKKAKYCQRKKLSC